MTTTNRANLNIVSLVNQLRRGAMMRNIECEFDRPSFWQLVFSQSKANGAPYGGEQLQGQIWDWPKDTFLQRRLREVRWFPANNAAFN